ncbi:carbohydrate kinase family protein [Vallitalea okinawensis]|uniref:carbohydrate kinase family protein n=1 Tax=Vallitalea okinawensis TaxID=2078660 RepID=UPI001FA9388A|nr:carbohydrate kinase family protein [Vallitalea okinawensis]
MCCVGIAVADVVVKPIRVIPEPGKLELIDSVTMHTGGCAVNVAIDLAQLGVNATICSLVGEDAFGDFLVSKLKEVGVRVEGIKTQSKVATSSSIVLSQENGERSFLHNIGANGIFGKSDIDWDTIKESDIIFVAGSLLMTKFDGQETVEFLKKVKSMNKTTLLDTAWDSTGAWFEKIEGCLQYVDYFMPSYEEAVMLSGFKKLEDIVDLFKSKGSKNVIIKCGSDGCYANCNNKVFEYPIFKVDVVDTNGAGDSFVAGFITGLCEDMSIEESLEFALAVGSFCVRSVGASTGIEHKTKVKQFIANYR